MFECFYVDDDSKHFKRYVMILRTISHKKNFERAYSRGTGWRQWTRSWRSPLSYVLRYPRKYLLIAKCQVLHLHTNLILDLPHRRITSVCSGPGLSWPKRSELFIYYKNPNLILFYIQSFASVVAIHLS